jgi:holo-[acyl-carrier protein] synthase
MRILGHGIDLTSIERIQKALEKSDTTFETRVFSPGEIAYCRAKKNPFPHFAARFAAKEAYGKAMGLGLGVSGSMVDVEVENQERGEPRLRLSGRAAELFLELGGKEIFLSLSHEGDIAIASVILVGNSY